MLFSQESENITRFGSTGNFVSVLVFGLSDLLGSTDPYEGTQAFVKVETDGFTAQAGCWLFPNDFRSFIPQLFALHRTLRGIAMFETLEQQVQIQLQGDGLGHIAVTGYLRAGVASDTELRFAFNIDQSDLNEPVRQLQAFRQN